MAVPGRIGAIVLALACGSLLTACASDQTELRSRCDGPNMIYETWVFDAADEQPEFELSQVQVVGDDPRCAPGGSGAPPPRKVER